RHSHQQAKSALQVLWAEALEKDVKQSAAHSLSTLLESYIRPNMHQLMAMVADNHFDTVLATSAAGGYAHTLGNKLGFNYIIASDHVEAKGKKKAEHVMALISAQGWNNRERIFFTDHEEDLPLIRQCHRVLWFGRDKDSLSIQADAPL